jgi:hypothetical protein
MPRLTAPKNGATFHFSLPGSVQGFEADSRRGSPGALQVANRDGRLALDFRALAPGQQLSATTPTFSPPNTPEMRTYELMATPLIYSGQWLETRISAPASNTAAVRACVLIKAYGENDALREIEGPCETLEPGASKVLRWQLPDTGGQPIQQLGFTLATGAAQANGTLLVDYVRWDGAPKLRLRRPDEPSDFWRAAWINSVSFFSKNFPMAFRISQSVGEGIIIHGTRHWTDYSVSARITVHLGKEGGLAFRTQGLRRYYALLLCRDGYLRLVKTRDGERKVLAEQPYDWQLEKPQQMDVTLQGARIRCTVEGNVVFDVEDLVQPYENGGIGLVIYEGALSTPEVHVGAAAADAASARMQHEATA